MKGTIAFTAKARGFYTKQIASPVVTQETIDEAANFISSYTPGEIYNLMINLCEHPLNFDPIIEALSQYVKEHSHTASVFAIEPLDGDGFASITNALALTKSTTENESTYENYDKLADDLLLEISLDSYMTIGTLIQLIFSLPHLTNKYIHEHVHDLLKENLTHSNIGTFVGTLREYTQNLINGTDADTAREDVIPTVELVSDCLGEIGLYQDCPAESLL